MKTAIGLALIVLAIVAGWAIVHSYHPLADTKTWVPMSSPGPLSAAHADIDHECAACHTANRGVEALTCIACHANDRALLQRQPTAFHATIQSCTECHREHEGRAARPIAMDHAALAAIALRAETLSDGRGWLRNEMAGWSAVRRASLGDPARLIARLECFSCHGNQDRHRTLFGRDCGDCHGPNAWSIPGYRHPSARSRDCSQCHAAPPSHYMEHFEMISEKIAGREHARVDQCWLCHLTTSWNDIRGVGYYKHH